jgi:collagen beta-1,O-galactosyltransferase
MKINNVHIITIDFDKVYIKEAVERIKNLNIEKNSKIIFGGVKGEVLTDDDLKNFIPYKNWNLKNSGNKFWDRELTIGEIGCVISHLKVWKQCVDNQTYPVLILEQDFNPVYNLNWEAFNEIENYDWDIIFLGHNNLDKQDKEIGFKNFIKPGYSYQAHAYILSESGLEKIKNYFQVLKLNLIPTDEFLPALYTKHPRPDIEAMYPNKMNALALRVDAIIQNDWEGTGRSRTAPK